MTIHLLFLDEQLIQIFVPIDGDNLFEEMKKDVCYRINILGFSNAYLGPLFQKRRHRGHY